MKYFGENITFYQLEELLICGLVCKPNLFISCNSISFMFGKNTPVFKTKQTPWLTVFLVFGKNRVKQVKWNYNIK